MSGGQRQRVALARALVMRPKVLLLDEPLSALDKKLRDQMQVELRALQRSIGITFILVTHDQEEALIMSDRIAVMFEGEIAQTRQPEGLYRRPVNKRVASFIGVMNFLPAQVLAAERHRSDARHPRAWPAPMVPRASGARRAVAGDIDTVGVRPEMLTLLFDDTDKSAAPGRGRGGRYAVLRRHDLLRCAPAGADAPVTISMRNTAGRSVAPAGSSVMVGWGADSIVVFQK